MKRLGPVKLLVVLAVIGLTTSNSAFGSLDGRVYEMVSPVYKAGYGASAIEAVAQGGDAVGYFSPGAFAGAGNGLQFLTDLNYIAKRSSAGWVTVPVMPPATLAAAAGNRDAVPDLSLVLSGAKLGSNSQGAEHAGSQVELLLHNVDSPISNWTTVGEMMLESVTKGPVQVGEVGVSNGFCHILLDASHPLLEEAVGVDSPLYDFVTGCNGEAVQLRLVALDDEAHPFNPSCPPELGIDEYSRGSYGFLSPGRTNIFNAISSDGKEIFFTTCIGNNIEHHQLFVRLDGERTIEISKPLAEPCGENELPCAGAFERANADFVGASEDGLRAYFTSKAALTGESDPSNSLYLADLGCRESEPDCAVASRTVTRLVRASRSPLAGGKSDVQGIIRVAPDGSRIYFVASGDLLSEARQSILEGEGRAVPQTGADNLYVYSADSDTVSFVGDLCSGQELSGEAVDGRCPSREGTDNGLWEQAYSEAQTAGADGRYLVFSSFAQLTKDDTDAAKDIYRYDAVTGELERVSAGEGGYHENGNDSRFDASINLGSVLTPKLRERYELDKRVVSEDGSRITFVSTEPLSPFATNGLANVYEWHKEPGWREGVVSLVSSGNAESPVEHPVMDVGGGNIFLVTTQGLVPQDIDGANDVYDARIGGGFPQQSAEREPCEGDACQGPLTNPAPLLVPGSALQTRGENVDRTTPEKSVSKRHSHNRHKRKTRKRRNSSNRVNVRH